MLCWSVRLSLSHLYTGFSSDDFATYDEVILREKPKKQAIKPEILATQL